MPTISPKAQAELNKLHDEADAARKAYVLALKQHRTNTVQVGILRGKVQAAKREYTNLYKSLGLNRQSAWQVDKVSRGLCRLCGDNAEPNSKHCKAHEAWLHSPVRKKKLVQP
jgi:hypothetical protein